jgi:DNA (cytosine-5)-methyltransferase 1
MGDAHLDLCSGIGAFSIAAEAAGWRTVAFSEIEPFPSAVLRHHWPDVPNLGDMRRIDGRDVVERFGPIELLTGGVPCQPASVAGKRRGSADERWLWPDFLRIVGEVAPRWIVAENPTGIVTLEPHGLDWISDGLEAAGYEVCPVVVGACHVGAPHRRLRAWIVGKLADSVIHRLEGHVEAGAAARATGGEGSPWPSRPGEPQHDWEEGRTVESPLGGATDGPSRRLARRAGRRRREQLKALGNAVVWQAAAEILKAIRAAT